MRRNPSGADRPCTPTPWPGRVTGACSSGSSRGLAHLSAAETGKSCSSSRWVCASQAKSPDDEPPHDDGRNRKPKTQLACARTRTAGQTRLSEACSQTAAANTTHTTARRGSRPQQHARCPQSFLQQEGAPAAREFGSTLTTPAAPQPLTVTRATPLRPHHALTPPADPPHPPARPLRRCR
jgi:hypothetical protein